MIKNSIYPSSVLRFKQKINGTLKFVYFEKKTVKGTIYNLWAKHGTIWESIELQVQLQRGSFNTVCSEWSEQSLESDDKGDFDDRAT